MQRNIPPSFDRDGIEIVPQACRTAIDEIECMTCSRIIPAGSAHRTCPVCSWKFVEAFGPLWFMQPWHTELIQMHKDFIAGGRFRAAKLHDALEADAVAEALPSTWMPEPEFYHAYQVVKDRYILFRESASRIHNHLVASKVTPLPSFAAVRKYLAKIKEELRDTGKVVEPCKSTTVYLGQVDKICASPTVSPILKNNSPALAGQAVAR